MLLRHLFVYLECVTFSFVSFLLGVRGWARFVFVTLPGRSFNFLAQIPSSTEINSSFSS